VVSGKPCQYTMTSIIRFGLFAALVFVGALAGPARAEARRDTYLEIVRGFYAKFQQPGFLIDDLLAYYTDDIDFRDPTFDITINGAAEFRGLYGDLGTDRTGYRDIVWTLADILVDGDSVLISGRWSGRYQDCPFDVEFMTLWRMRGRLIGYQRDFFASDAFDRQVGWADGKANCAVSN